MQKKTKVTVVVVVVLVAAAKPLADLSREIFPEGVQPVGRFLSVLIVLVVGCLGWFLAHNLIRERRFQVVECPNEDCRAHVLSNQATCPECGAKLDGDLKVVAETTDPQKYD